MTVTPIGGVDMSQLEFEKVAVPKNHIYLVLWRVGVGLILSSAIILMIREIYAVDVVEISFNGFADWQSIVKFLNIALLVIGVLLFLISQIKINQFHSLISMMRHISKNQSIDNLSSYLSTIEAKKEENLLLSEWWQSNLSMIHLVRNEQRKVELALEVEEVSRKRLAAVSARLERKRASLPIEVAKKEIGIRLEKLKAQRALLTQQWQEAYKKFSWWDKLNRSQPDFSEMDETISAFERAYAKVLTAHSSCEDELNRSFSTAFDLAKERIQFTESQVKRHIEESELSRKSAAQVMNTGFWFAAMSIPVSLWNDLTNAGDVYDALRRVNSNFEGMSDADIWLESLLLSSSSLAGLTSLTKGAYFEALVAEGSGGVLFENFNHAGTDITIDGIEFQIKATDSVNYIYSVDESIPVIATTEVADRTGVTDGGYSDAELQGVVDNALGGTVIDVGDTAVDAWLAGLGGLGVMASIQGLDRAFKSVENGGDKAEAAMEGLAVAIEGTAKAAVGTAELAYKVATSAPSRFVGRAMLGGLKALDRKLEGTGTSGDNK
ncbi:MAG: hypothetical protein ACJA2K_000059 [Thalassolituus sp.]|jgi:hypothetical protein